MSTGAKKLRPPLSGFPIPRDEKKCLGAVTQSVHHMFVLLLLQLVVDRKRIPFLRKCPKRTAVICFVLQKYQKNLLGILSTERGLSILAEKAFNFTRKTRSFRQKLSLSAERAYFGRKKHLSAEIPKLRIISLPKPRVSTESFG